MAWPDNDPEGVCPHCIRIVKLTPKKHVISSHISYTWILVHENDHVKYRDYISNKAMRCPGTHRKPLRGEPAIDQDPPAYCEL
jgi:hypothetical protein